MSQLAEIARKLVAPQKGILAADESSGTIEKRFKSIDLASTEDNRRAYRELLFTTAGRRAVHQRRDPLRRDDPPEGEGRHALPDAAREARNPPGHQGRQGHQAVPFSKLEKITEGLDGLRERIARVPRPRRPLREVAGGDRDRRRNPERHLHRDQRARARALRRALRRGRAGADRGARGADGRRAHDRALLRGDGAHAARGLPLPLRAARAARADPAQAEHGALGHRAARSRRASARSPSRRCAASATRCRRRCRASCSCRAARATSWRPPT